MIRLDEAQYLALVRAGKKPANQPPMKSRVKSRLKEADVTKQCVQLMEAHGWKAIRLQRGLMRRRDGTVAMTIGEKGMCDWLFIRSFAMSSSGNTWQYPGQTWAFMCELKSEGKKPSASQVQFMADMRSRGLVAEWFDSYDKFAEFVRLTFGVK